MPMKCLWIMLVLSWVSINSIIAQFYEPFNYAAGSNLENQAIWTAFSPGDSIIISANNLSVKGLSQSFGNSIAFDSDGADYFRTFAPLNQTAWYSFIFRVPSLGGLNQVSGGVISALGNLIDDSPVAFCRLRSQPPGYNIGLANSFDATKVVWDDKQRGLSSTNFVVVNYVFKPGLNNDVANLWINPNFTTFGTPVFSTPTLSVTNLNVDDLANPLDRLVLFQLSFGETPSLVVDEIRVGSTYASVTPSFGGSIVRIANAANSSEAGTNGVFSIQSTATNFPFTLTYTLSGSATPAIDYTMAPPATYDSVVITNANQPLVILPINDALTNEVNPEAIIITLEDGGPGWLADPNFFKATNFIFEGSTITNITNNFPPPPINTNINNPLPVIESIPLTGFNLSLKRPKSNKSLHFLNDIGFKVKGRILTTNSVLGVSYLALSEDTSNIPNNLNFISAGKVTPITKGKFYKQGFRVAFKSTLSTKPGVNMPLSTTSIKMITRVRGAVGTNTGYIYFTNVFPAQVR